MTALLDLPGVTYSRTGGATAWRADGTLAEFAANVPRITDAGITIEGQRTNLFARWDPTAAQIGTKGNCTDVAAPAVAPLAERNWITLDNTAATAFGYQAPSLTASTVYTLSALVETPDGSQPIVGGSATGDFGFYVSGLAAAVSPSYKKLIGNVWLASIQVTTPPDSIQALAGVVRYSTQSKRPLKFSGFQLEQASTPSTPIIATGAAATRGGDMLSLAGGILAPEGTIVLSYVAPPQPAARKYGWQQSDTGNGRFALRIGEIGGITAVRLALGDGAAISELASGNLTPGTLAKVAVSYSTLAAKMALCVNGTDQTAARQLTAAVISSLFKIGQDGNGDSAADTTLQRLLIIPRYLTPAERMEMTR